MFFVMIIETFYLLWGYTIFLNYYVHKQEGEGVNVNVVFEWILREMLEIQPNNFPRTLRYSQLTYSGWQKISYNLIETSLLKNDRFRHKMYKSKYYLYLYTDLNDLNKIGSTVCLSNLGYYIKSDLGWFYNLELTGK